MCPTAIGWSRWQPIARQPGIDEARRPVAERALVDGGLDDRPGELLLHRGRRARRALELEHQLVVEQTEVEVHPRSSSTGRAVVHEVVGRLGDGQLEVGHLLGLQRREPADGGEREPGKHQVLGLGGNGQGDVATVSQVGAAPPRLQHSENRAEGAFSGRCRRAAAQLDLHGAPVAVAKDVELTALPARSVLIRSVRSWLRVSRSPLTERITSPPARSGAGPER